MADYLSSSKEVWLGAELSIVQMAGGVEARNVEAATAVIHETAALLQKVCIEVFAYLELVGFALFSADVENELIGPAMRDA